MSDSHGSERKTVQDFAIYNKDIQMDFIGGVADFEAEKILNQAEALTKFISGYDLVVSVIGSENTVDFREHIFFTQAIWAQIAKLPSGPSFGLISYRPSATDPANVSLVMHQVANLANTVRQAAGPEYVVKYSNNPELQMALDVSIKEWLRRSAASLPPVPPQLDRALIFGGEDGLPLGLIDPPGAGLLDTPDQRQGFFDLIEKAKEVQERCAGSNRLASLRLATERLLSTMGEQLSDLRVRAFWSQMNSLRRRLDADLRSQRVSDPDIPPLPEDAFGLLLDLVQTLNVFAALEPKLEALDELATDPADRARSPEVVDASLRVSSIITETGGILSTPATDSLRFLAEEAAGDGNSAQRAKQFLTRSVRNLLLEIIRRSLSLLRSEAVTAAKEIRSGFYRAAGAVLFGVTLREIPIILSSSSGVSLELALSALARFFS